MAITPDEAKQMSEKETSIVNAAEDIIDALLRERFVSIYKVVIIQGSDFPTLSQNDFTERVVEALKQKYRQAGTGWRVSYNVDQRDGGVYFQFTDKRIRPTRRNKGG